MKPNEPCAFAIWIGLDGMVQGPPHLSLSAELTMCWVALVADAATAGDATGA